MGLDISAVKITPINESEINFSTNEDENSKTFALDGFERTLLPHERIKLIWNDEEFEHENASPIDDGSISIGYFGYNTFRSQLAIASIKKNATEIWEEARTLQPDQNYPHPIYHIINFADNEGFIGPEAVKAVSSYFEENKEEIHQNMQGDHFKNFFLKFANVFKLAADVYPHGFIELS